MRTETRVGIFIVGAIAVFFYLSLNIGEFRMDRNQYYPYRAYFDDTGGLEQKALVKIAGVSVGWVDAITLLEGGKAEVIVRINKNNRLAKNAYAMIVQEGLIGNKSVEIDPGDPSTGQLMPGGILAMPGRSPTSVADLLDQFREIATNIQDIVFSMKKVIASPTGEKQMNQAIDGIAQASTRMAHFSQALERTMQRNEDHINKMIEDLEKTAHHLDIGIPSITEDIHYASNSLARGVDSLSKSVSGAGDKMGAAFENLEDTSSQVHDTFSTAGQVVRKINDGTGILGKLINEDETYGDLRKTLKGFKNYATRLDNIGIQIDMHSENMFRTNNAKGYFDLRIRPRHDYYYIMQLAVDDSGLVQRKTSFYTRLDKDGHVIPLSEMSAIGKRDYPDILEKMTQRKNRVLFGFQFAKRFDRLTFRVGLFESTFGVGCDFYVPLKTDWVHWITSLEAFDFRGYNRLTDTRPHIKWINRAYFMRHFYTAFGLDDVASKQTASPFLGGGIRFGDDDIKYLLSMIPFGQMANR